MFHFNHISLYYFWKVTLAKAYLQDWRELDRTAMSYTALSMRQHQ